MVFARDAREVWYVMRVVCVMRVRCVVRCVCGVVRCVRCGGMLQTPKLNSFLLAMVVEAISTASNNFLKIDDHPKIYDTSPRVGNQFSWSVRGWGKVSPLPK